MSPTAQLFQPSLLIYIGKELGKDGWTMKLNSIGEKLLDKVVDCMIGLDNFKGKLVHADKLFAKKPQNLGENLARIKKKFGIVGQETSLIPSSRRYIAQDGSTVHFSNINLSSGGSGLSIYKEVQPVSEAQYNKTFSNKLAEIHKNYLNTNVGDTVCINRGITIKHFRPVKLDQTKGDLVASHNMCRPNVQALNNNNFSRKYYHNEKDIPYAKACSMGLKV